MESDDTIRETIQVRVLLFSVLREMLAAERLDLELMAPATGATLLDRLSEAHPELGTYRDAVRLAVNERYVDPTTSLSEGDEVALITAVSGG